MVERAQRFRQKDLLTAVHSQDWQQLSFMLTQQPGLSRFIVAGLHETDPARLDRFLHAFKVIAETFEIERLRDFGRKLLWMLNDESGNHCPNASLALAAIAEVQYDVVAPHLPVMEVHANDPSPAMATTCRRAIQLIEEQREDVHHDE